MHRSLLEEELLSLLPSDDDDEEVINAFEITRENAKGCVDAYNAGRKVESRESTPSAGRVGVFQICYEIGIQDQRAITARQELDATNETAIKVRACASGFSAGRVRATRGLPHPESYHPRPGEVGQLNLAAYAIGYDVGYASKFETSPKQLKRKREFERIEVTELVAQLNVSGGRVIEITIELAEEIYRAYKAGRSRVKKNATLLLPMTCKGESEIYQISYNIGCQDEIATEQQQELDTSETAIKVRACASGFASGGLQVYAGLPHPESYRSSKYNKISARAFYVVGYNAGYAFTLERILNDYNMDVMEEEKKDAQIEILEEEVMEEVVVAAHVEDGTESPIKKRRLDNVSPHQRLNLFSSDELLGGEILTQLGSLPGPRR